MLVDYLLSSGRLSLRFAVPSFPQFSRALTSQYCSGIFLDTFCSLPCHPFSHPIPSTTKFVPLWLHPFVPSSSPYVSHSVVACKLYPLIPYHQSRFSFARAGVASARFSSTAPKQSTLKERLAELIPAELENVCFLWWCLRRSKLAVGQANTCSAWQKGIRSCPRRSTLWACLSAILHLQSFNLSLYRGMRGLPALIWEGSVLDAGGSCRQREPEVAINECIKRKEFASAESLFPNARNFSPKRLVALSLYLKASSGFLSLAKSQHRSKSLPYPETGQPVLLSPSLLKRSSIDALLHCIQ